MKDRRSRNPGWSSTVTIVVIVSVLVLVVLAVVYSIFGVAYLVRGDDGISDNWVGALAGVGLFGGLGVTAINLVAALGHLRHVRTRPILWLALLEFPVFLATVVLLEVFLFE